ncbi:MAG: SirB2 family protein [Steroidobacteraceae bacterium]|nr:SirB2 family protein [Steroidobacteraceae bacterium]
MIEFYPQIKLVHIVSILASGVLFLIRAIAVQRRWPWAMAAPVRYLSYSIDTVLLTSALMLMSVLQQYPFVHSWLTVKILLVIVYIVLGSFALKRGPTPAIRLACSIAAVLVYGVIITIARAHDPAGALRWVMLE